MDYLQQVVIRRWGDCPGFSRQTHRRVKALEAERDAARCTIQWRFTSQQARRMLADLYAITAIS
jgi:hypothetical protein